MKINFVKKIEVPVYLAFSGGIDSCVLLDLLLKRKVDVELIVVDHQNEFSDIEVEFTKKVAEQKNLCYTVYKIEKFDGKGSQEAYWSRQRKDIFESLDRPVLTGHHLNDAVEWWVMSCMTGTPKLMDYESGNVFRPLILTPKKSVLEYRDKYEIEHLVDPSNEDCSSILRNKVRHNLMPEMKKVFPGMEAVVSRLLRKKIL